MPFEITQILRDEESVRLYLERYKAFRLHALLTDPDSFGSTYAREIAFNDEFWYQRLANPKCATFVALEADKIVCTATAVGPLQVTPEESSPSRNPIEISSADPEAAEQLHWRINGMFTRREYRGQGIAKALLRKVIEYGMDEANKAVKAFNASIAVDDDNPAALSLYKKCGFITIREEPWFRDRPRIALLMKYAPTPESSKVLTAPVS